MIAKTREFITKNGITQSMLARSIGVSAAQISQYLKDEYKGDVAGLETKQNDNQIQIYGRQNNERVYNQVIATLKSDENNKIEASKVGKLSVSHIFPPIWEKYSHLNEIEKDLEK